VDDDGGASVPHICVPMPIESAEDLDALGEDVEAGRGLTLVAALSSAWGVLGDQTGRAVWVEILIPRKDHRECLQVLGGLRVVPGPAAAPQRQGVLVDWARVCPNLRTPGQRRTAGESWAQFGRSGEPLLCGSSVIAQD
jgi:hypothetical protein